MMQKLFLTRLIPDVESNGHEEITELYSRIATWYEALAEPTQAQQDIAEAASAAVYLVIGDHEQFARRTIDDFTRARNMLTLCVVPESHIAPEQRAALMARAEAGEDVYCYGSATSPTRIINLWDTDTRIPLYPLSQYCWQLTEARLSNIAQHSSLWALKFAPVNEGQPQTVLLSIERRVGEDDTTYQPRAGRVAQMIVGNINFYGDEPSKYHGCHF